MKINNYMNNFIVYVYLYDEIIHIDGYNTFEEAQKSVDEWFELDKDQILSYDIIDNREEN